MHWLEPGTFFKFIYFLFLCIQATFVSRTMHEWVYTRGELYKHTSGRRHGP